MKRTHLIYAFIFLSLFIIPVYAGETEDMFIPQSSPIYNDFHQMAEEGLIKSVPAEQFLISPMTEYDAAGYVVEAAAQYAQAGGAQETGAGTSAKLKQYFDTYKKKAFEIYGKTMEMRNKLANIETLLKSPDIKSFDVTLDEAKVTMFDVESEFAKTTFRGVPPFKVMGELQVRWQDVESFGISHVHQTSLGGTMMSLWTEGIVSPDVGFKLNLNFERPADEADKGDSYAEYWGTGQRFLDKYTIYLNLYGWQINTGFFWEDITPFIAKGILSDRPAFFDRDPYVLEETTKGHFENAFLHSFIKRGDIWSMHSFYGAEFMNMALPGGGRVKVMGGKAEKFDENWDKLFLYEFAGRFTQPIDIGIFNGSEASLNFFNTSNEKAEIETLAPAQPTDNFPPSPDGYIQEATIVGGDAKLRLFNVFNINGEFEHADTFSYLLKQKAGVFLMNGGQYGYLPRYHQEGTALFLDGLIKKILPVELELKYTRLDPDYLANASAVNDTANRKVNTALNGVDIKWDSYAGDPTLLYNNISRLDARASIEMPVSAGFINLSYGNASQIKPTDNLVYADHYLFGNRLTGAMWWHLFFSQYGNAVSGRDNGFYAYNAIDNPEIPGSGKGLRYLFTDKWLTNKEMIKSTDPNSASGADQSVKFSSNASVEFKLSLHKILSAMGIQSNNLFLEVYDELNTLRPGSDVMPTFDPDTLFSQNIFDSFIVYNMTRKTNIMFEYAFERWSTRHSWVAYQVNALSPTGYDYRNLPIDYMDQNFGVGFDYDFAPRTSLYIRIKRFMHDDMVVPTQSFNGWYLGFEIKNFF